MNFPYTNQEIPWIWWHVSAAAQCIKCLPCFRLFFMTQTLLKFIIVPQPFQRKNRGTVEYFPSIPSNILVICPSGPYGYNKHSWNHLSLAGCTPRLIPDLVLRETEKWPRKSQGIVWGLLMFCVSLCLCTSWFYWYPSGCFPCPGAILWFPQCQWSSHKNMGK